MPRANTARKIIIADTEEELMALTNAAQEPGEGPGTPQDVPPVPVPPEEPEEPEDPQEGEEEGIEEEDLDDPEDDPDAPKDALQAHNDLRRQLYGAQRKPVILDGEVLDRPVQRYEGRINIVEAWQYPGSVQNAPQWVDRNWIGYGDYDTVRMIEPGPCLRVPNAAGEITLCRIGDYIAQQEVRIDDDLSDLRIEVWAKEHFQKLFMPR